MKYSGHGHRVVLLMTMLGLPYHRIDVDPALEEQKAPNILKLNPFAQVPIIIDDGLVVTDSNAILIYLARKYGGDHLIPTDPVGEAAMQRWFSLAAGEIAFGPCAARRLRVFDDFLVPAYTAQAITARLFSLLDDHFSSCEFAVGSGVTLADLAAYAYIARSEEGLIDLGPYEHLRAWLRRIEALPHFVPMPVATQFVTEADSKWTSTGVLKASLETTVEGQD